MARINDNFTLRAPVPYDDRKGWWDDSTGEWKPFNDVQHALDTVVYYRYRTLTLPVVYGGDVVEYWFKEGVEDSDFVQKNTAADLSNYYTKSETDLLLDGKVDNSTLLNYYTKTELQTSGQAQVHWDNITNIPDLSVTWENITGDQSVIGNAGFTNDAGYITLGDLPSPLTFENGLYEDSGVVKLGLDLSTIGTTNSGAITEDLFLTRLDGSGNPYYQVIFGVDSLPGLYFTHVSDTSDPSNVQSGLVLSNNQAILSRNNSSGGQSLNIGLTNNMVVSDTINMKGLEEPADYSANKTQYSYVTLKMLQDAIPELTGYATEQWVLDQNYLTSVSSSWNINTGDLTIQGDTHNLDGRYMLRSNTITSGYGIIASSDFTGPVNIEVNTTILDNRYLRKDVNDSNDSFNLTLGTLDVGDTSIDGTLNISSIATGLITDDLLIRDAATGDIKSIPMPSFGGAFNVANNLGVTQFSVDSGDSLRINATGDASVSFNAGTKTITINSSGGSTGGGVDSWNARNGHVVPESGDYTTAQVTESGNLYFTQARVRSTTLTGLSVTNSDITNTDNILQAFGKAQGQINARVPTSREITINGTSGNITVGGGNTQNLASNPSWTVNLSTVGSAGTYTKVVTDAYGRVTAGGVLTVSDLPSSVIQTLGYTAPDSSPSITSGGIVSISDGNSISINTLFLASRPDADLRYNGHVFSPYYTSSGNTGYPSTSIAAGWRIERRSGDTSQLGMEMWTSGNTSGEPVIYMRNFSSESSYSDWVPIASRTWVTSQLPTNYISTSGNQTGLSGNKTTSGTWTFSGATSVPVVIERTGTNANSSIQYITASGSIYAGQGTGNSFGVGSTANLAADAWLNVWADGMTYASSNTNNVNAPVNGFVFTRNSSGGYIQGGGATTVSWTLRNYTTGSGIQLSLNDGGYDGPVTSTVADGPYYAGGNVILGANNTGGTVVAAQSDTVYLRPNGANSGTNQATFGSSITLSALSGSGTQMVVANASGVLSRQAIPISANNGTLTLNTGTGLSGSASFSANQSGNASFTVSAASGYAIPTTGQISNWNTAYGWGNHAGLYVSRSGDDITRNAGDWPNTINSDPNNYINSRILSINTGNNGLHFFGDQTQNSRRFGIQSGHGNGQFATAYGTLELNPYGGDVRVNGGLVWHSGNLTGGATTILTSNLTANRALVSSGSGKVAHAGTSTTEINYLMGVTSSVQAQLNGKAPTTHNHTWSQLSGGSTSLIPGAGSTASHGSITVSGAKGNYAGINFSSADDYRFMIHQTVHNSGLYNGSAWVWQWNADGTLATGTVPWDHLTGRPQVIAGTSLSGGGYLTGNVTLNFAPGGTTSQYIRGDGSLATFPSIPSVGNGTLTMSTGSGLTGSATFSANQSGSASFSIGLDSTVIRTTGNQSKSGVLTLSSELMAHSVRLDTAASSGTTINMATVGLLRLSNISSSTTYTLSNNADGRQVQCHVTNTGGSSISVSVTGARLLGLNTIRGGGRAVISIVNFGNETVYSVLGEA